MNHAYKIPVSASNATGIMGHQQSTPRWKPAKTKRVTLSGSQSEYGRISHRLWNNVLRQKGFTCSIPPEEVRLQRELADILRDCSEPDWNGYNANPIDRRSVSLVCSFLQQLPSSITYPELSPEPSGNLTMVWQKNGYHLIVGINPNKIIAWGGTSPQNGHVYGDAPFDTLIPIVLLELLKKIEGCNY
jgi:hypothetical protein